ncbi:MAG TPA: hypothetical protein VGI54_08360, partial [Solirubrobacteraceae bacterium]
TPVSPARRNGDHDGRLDLRVWAQEAEAAAGIARALATTPFVPDGLRRYTNPDERDPKKKILDLDGTVATVTAVLLAGQELGLGPMASLRSITIIKGTVGLYALAARALLLQAGHEIVVRESTGSRAIVDGRRNGGEWQRSTWDTDRARQAGLLPGEAYSNWRRQTKAMLVARATAEAARWVAADAMLGLPVMVEEIEDGEAPAAIESATTEPPGPAPPGAAEPPKTTGRKTTGRKTTPARAALPAGPPSAPAPPPPEQQQPPEPEPPRRAAPRVTPKTRNAIHARLTGLGITDRDEALGLIGLYLHHPVEGTGDLTPDEGTVIIERLDALIARTRPPPEAEPEAEAEAETKPPDDPEGPPPDAEPD